MRCSATVAPLRGAAGACEWGARPLGSWVGTAFKHTKIRRVPTPGEAGSWIPGGAVGVPFTMPCASVHLLLAGRVLDEWTRAPSTAPLPTGSGEFRRAFLSGALAPDAGFVPGTDRALSELAHYVRPGDLARAILGHAQTLEERAFALGWATHVLADVELHPLVGRAVGDRLFGDRERRVNTADDEATHVSLEVGLDLQVLDAEGPNLPEAPAVGWVQGAGEARLLLAALGSTYGLSWRPAPVVADQRRSAWMMRLWPRALRVVAHGGDGAPGGGRGSEGALSRLLSLARGRATPKTAARGFLAPERPPAWVMESFWKGAEGFPVRFQEAVESGLATLGNRNLETGVEQPRGSGHPATDRAWARLGPVRG
jgi:hypothetical protein